MADDADLMLAVREGDPEAFGQLVLRHQQAAWNAAYRFVGDRAKAEDIAQEAFLRVLQSAAEYRPTASFRTYLYRVVTRLCIDHARRKQPASLDVLPRCLEPSALAPDVLVAQERTEAVRDALQGLPAKQRMAVVLRYYEGLSTAEITAAMETTTKAVERLLARGRAALESRLAGFLKE